MAMDEQAWQAWSAQVNRRLAIAERRCSPDGVLVTAMVDLVRQLRSDILASGNRVRAEMNLPLEKMLPMPPKPRHRMKAGSAPWP